MLSKDDVRYARVAQLIDDFMTIDFTGVGLTKHIYDALQAEQPGPACMGAAELLHTSTTQTDGPVLIATGFPEGGGVPETDGPVGAAMLARAIFLGLRRHSVVVIDEDWADMMHATLRGAGMHPLALPDSGVADSIEFLRPVYVKAIKKDDRDSRAQSDDLIALTAPCAAIAIERPGLNDHGLYNGLGGRPLDGLVADLDYLFSEFKARNVPFIGIADGGNELGMGRIAEQLRTFSPKARESGIPGRGGVAAVTAADWLVTSNVSNWGATGVIAALSALLENPIVMHEPELEIRSIEACVASGGVDGMFMAPEPAVDGLHAREWQGLIGSLRASVQRTLGDAVNWQGDRGDWRQNQDDANTRPNESAASNA